ncbi:MAG: serine hydrolase [Candidatus Aminicenantes bacterium]|nr:serine hydrolase [Candidatus Aminicenantes bacterium]
MRIFIIIFLLTLYIFSPALPQTSVNEIEAEADKIFEPWSKPGIPGAAVAIVQDGRPLLVKGYGCADLVHNIPITTKTPFNAASLAKQFTAFAVLMLEEQGKLSLDDYVRSYIPEFPDFSSIITIRHLLYHTSGLRDYGGLMLMSGNRMDDVFTSQAILKLISNQKELNFKPGTETAYNNAGYIVLAEIVARTCGLSYAEWTRNNIFIPLGMEKAVFKENIGEIIPGAAQSYTPSGDKEYLQAFDNEAAPGPGSLFVSIEDMAHWLAAFETRTVGTREMWTKLFETGKLQDGRDLPYAAGLIIGSYKRLPVFFHSGRWAGYRSDMVYFPEQNFAVAVLTNNSGLNPTQISRRIASFCLKGLFPRAQPKQSPAIEVEDEVLDAYTGRYWLRGEQTIRITRRDKNLFAQISGDIPVKLFAETADTFAYKTIDAKIQFFRTASAKAHKITFWQGAYAVSAERLPDEEWKPSVPEKFCGFYLSEELEEVLEVRAGTEGLYMPFIRRSDLLLVPISKDRFAGKNSSVKIFFSKDGDGNINELFFSLLDAWKVRFAKNFNK